MRVRFMTLFAGWLALTAPGPIQAEPFVDLYGGWSKSRNTHVSASQRTCYLVVCTTSTQTTQPLTFQSGASAGVRGGYWFDRLLWFGVAGDPVVLSDLFGAGPARFRFPLGDSDAAAPDMDHFRKAPRSFATLRRRRPHARVSSRVG